MIGRANVRQSPAPLTRQEILARWPETEPPPRPDSLWRTLTRGCELGILVRSGAGTKAEAFRYGLAEGLDYKGYIKLVGERPSAQKVLADRKAASAKV